MAAVTVEDDSAPVEQEQPPQEAVEGEGEGEGKGDGGREAGQPEQQEEQGTATRNWGCRYCSVTETQSLLSFKLCHD